nr:MAG TPA: hypothetical protein [Caudoviricetes sp.]
MICRFRLRATAFACASTNASMPLRCDEAKTPRHYTTLPPPAPSIAFPTIQRHHCTVSRQPLYYHACGTITQLSGFVPLRFSYFENTKIHG